MSILHYEPLETAVAVQDAIGPLPKRPAYGFRRPALMSALALAEHLMSAQVPLPADVRIATPYVAGSEVVVDCLHYDLDGLLAWQEAFGGTVRHELRADYQVYSALEGRVFDGLFKAWVLRSLSPERQADERLLTAQWVAEHGDRDDWAAETASACRAAILRFRLEVAA
ncbi:hypothetical protein [Kitasatospora cineracea]|uniref:hypothetical protein n=1 Tax=Kitasatospora cineracea TaxID=88074 RepID=UPI0036C80134